MIPSIIPMATGLGLILYTLVSYYWKIRVRSYLRFMVIVDFMVIMPLIVLSIDIADDNTLAIIILAIVIAGLILIGIQYADNIGTPYQRMFAGMVRVVDNKDLKIQSISELDLNSEMKRLQSKQQTFIESVRQMIEGITRENSNIDGYLTGIDNQVSQMSAEINKINDDVDQILQNAAIIAESIDELRNQSIQFIDRTDSNFDLLVEISNSSDRITDQTNIIAVNAAIEAAQSEAGSNFATVADGIQSLSKRSRETTDKLFSSISQLRSSTIKEIQEMNRKLDQLEDMIFEMGELANRSSSFTHQQLNFASEITSINEHAKKSNTRLRGSYKGYSID